MALIPFCVSALVTDGEGRFLCGLDGDFRASGAYGGINAGEAPERAARRTVNDKFGIRAGNLVEIGALGKSSDCDPTMVYLCRSYQGKIENGNGELTIPGFVEAAELEDAELAVDPVLLRSIYLLQDTLTGRADGGPGSGNFNHVGRIGEVGGSGKAGATIDGEFVSKDNKRGNEEKIGKHISDLIVKSGITYNPKESKEIHRDLSDTLGLLEEGDAFYISYTDRYGKHTDEYYVTQVSEGIYILDEYVDSHSLTDNFGLTKEDLANTLFMEYGGEKELGCEIKFGPKEGEPTGARKKALENEAIEADAYSQEKKDAATWKEPKEEIHNSFIEAESENWKNASEAEKRGMRAYTSSGYDAMNAALYSGDYENGDADSWTVDKIDGATSYLNKCHLNHPAWVERGCGTRGHSVLGVEPELIERVVNGESGALEELQSRVIGTTRTQAGLLSAGAQKGAGWPGEVVLNMFLPEGSHASYAEPYSVHGYNGATKEWDGGIKTPDHFGEFEMIVQRSAQMTFTNMSVSGHVLYVDCDVYTPDID